MRRIADNLVAALVRLAFFLLRLPSPEAAAAAGGALARSVGPLLKQHRVALRNLAIAFPEWPEHRRRAVARQAWDNLGRVAAEYVHMDRIWDFDPDRPNAGRIVADPAVVQRVMALRDDGKPALIFAAHTANWELPALVGPRHGLPSAALFRTPNNPVVARDVLALRRTSMGRMIPTGILAPRRVIEALEEGLHVGMLVDQHFSRGPRVPFFGREVYANPLIGQLARRFECPVHGARAIRLPGGRFRLELTEELVLPRDAEGKVDVQATTALVNQVIEGWVREHPGQWLWMHRRWR